MAISTPVPKRPAETRYKKSVQPPPAAPLGSGLRVLKDGESNTKIGGELTKGRWKGFRLFTLTLEERATCWDGCVNWERCYGDGMPFAKRYTPGADLEAALVQDLDVLATRHAGFVVRLHVLGDFYSPAYVQFWAQQIERVPQLHLYGYTHWRYDHPIGAAVARLVMDYPLRASFLRSDQTLPEMFSGDPLPNAATVDRHAKEPVIGSVFCPEQTGKTDGCYSCGLCMNGRTSVTFLDHSRQKRTLQVVG